MKSPKIISDNVMQKGGSLRQKAEAHLKVNKSNKISLSGLSTELTESGFLKEFGGETDPIGLLHELEVHQIELEMQNDELKLAVEKAATATALYDFAPAGYFTLNREGIICQLNLSGANLLGKDRSRLIDSHFSQFLSPESLPVFNDFFRNIFQTNTRQVCELWFLLQENSSFFIHLEGIVDENPEKCLLTAINITERKRAEQIITESEANLNSLINNRDESIWSIDSDYNFVIFNKFFLDEYFASFNIELKKGMNALENISSKLSELWKEKYDTALSGKRVYFEYSNHVGKELHYYEVFLNPIISKGKITGVSALSANISYRKRAEKALRRSESKYRKLHESMMDGFVYVNMDGRIREFNESYLRMLEYSPDEITQLSYTDITPEKWISYEEEIVENQVLLRGYSEVYEKEYRKKNGTVFPVELRTVLSKDEHGKNEGMWAIVRDITERKRADDQLLESEYFFKESQHAAFIGSYKFDVIADHWESSEVFDKIFGIEKSYERNFQGWFDILHPDDRALMDNYFRDEVLLKKNPFNKEYRIVRKSDGKTRWVQGSGQLGFDAEGNVISMIGTIQDITDRKLSEDALKQSEARLQELNATKDKFFSIIAHDLKNPFNSIIGFSNLLARQIYENNYEGIAKYGMIIQNSSQRAMDLLMNLLEWSRIQTGSIAFNPECIEVAELTNSVLKSLIDSASQKTIKISIKFPPLVFVFADKEMISTVLRNVISNAIKFTHPGGEIVISAERKQAEWVITIADNGVGIKKDAIDKLFRIDQSYSTLGTQNEKGTGLGLLLCKEFVEKNGGKIWVESEYGGSLGTDGSKFHFTVPKG
ncbi:MAG: PAS domain S-box protein [Prolixibacteraceae bacterium]|nr:PAS domain S-box protein [Prolixibacteraceae bacterium]